MFPNAAAIRGLSRLYTSQRLVCLTRVFLLISFLLLPAFASDIDNVNAQAESDLMKQGEKAFHKENFDLAESSFRKALELNKLNNKAKLRLSHVLYKKRLLVEAYFLAYEVAKTENQNPYALALVGNILLSAGNFKGARPFLDTAIRLDTNNALAGFGLGMLDFYENRLEDSRQKLDWAAFKDPEEPDYVLAYAQVSARLEKYRESAEAYRAFLRVAPNTDKDRRDRIRGLIDFLEFLGTKSKLYEIGGGDRSQISIELINDRPIIRIRTGKKNEEYRFVIDTGSNITVISQKTADLLHVKPVARGGTARGVGGDGKFDIVYGFLSVLSVGDAKIKNVPVYIRQFPEGMDKYDGYIGLAVISKFLTEIDFGNMTLTMTRRKDDDYKNDAAPAAENEFIANLRLTPSGFLSGEVTLSGVELPLNFIVDTGAELSVISTELAERDGVKKYLGTQKMRVIGAAGVTDGVPLFNLGSVSVGQHSIEDVRAIALNLSVINENAGFEQSGILGGNFLKHYRLKFDFQKYTLSFTPITPSSVPRE
jgi:tetratricopeptide (TPR) repeat protein